MSQPLLNEITDFNGNKWPSQWVDTYNNYTTHFNDIKGSGDLANQEREAILNRRHQFFVLCLNSFK